MMHTKSTKYAHLRKKRNKKKKIKKKKKKKYIYIYKKSREKKGGIKISWLCAPLYTIATK